MFNVDAYIARKQAQQDKEQRLAKQTAQFAAHVLAIVPPEEDTSDTFSTVFSSNAQARDIFSHPQMLPPDVDFPEVVDEEYLWRTA
jgi:hypothetical protein